MPSQNTEVNPIETRFLSHDDDSLGYTQTGHDNVAAGAAPDEQELPDNIAEDNGLLTSAAA